MSREKRDDLILVSAMALGFLGIPAGLMTAVTISNHLNPPATPPVVEKPDCPEVQ